MTLRINSKTEWEQWAKTQRPSFIPCNPPLFYRGQGWQSWGDWLGTGSTSPKHMKYKSFKEARAFVRSLKLKTGDEWKAYCVSGKKPADIPRCPEKVYEEHQGMGDWLGTGRVAFFNKDFMPFSEAKKYAQQLALTDCLEWRKFCASGKRPGSIPASPNHTYRDKGWQGWGDFLGTGNTRGRRKKR